VGKGLDDDGGPEKGGEGKVGLGGMHRRNYTRVCPLSKKEM